MKSSLQFFRAVLLIYSGAVQGQPTCSVTNIAQNIFVTQTTANINWFSNQVPGQNHEIFITSEDIPQPAGAGIAVVGNSYYATGLLSGTTYKVWVRAICSNTLAGAWSAPAVFTTQPINVQCPESDQCIYTFHPLDSFGDGWNNFTMSVRQNGQQVGLINPGGAFSTAPPYQINLCPGQPFELFWNTGGSFANEIAIEVRNPFGQMVYYKPPGVGTPGSVIYTGEVTCTVNACHTPVDLVVTTQYTAAQTYSYLYWSGGGATSWEVFYNPQGAPAPGPSDVGITTTSSPFLLTNLQPGVLYDFYVRAICDASSEWSEPYAYSPESGIVKLKVFLDENSNGLHEPAEPFFPHGNYQIQINNEAAYLITQSWNGFYNITDNNVSNLYDFSYVLNPQYSPFYSVDASFEDVLVATAQSTEFLFPVQILQPFQDLSVTVGNNGAPRPGLSYFTNLFYQNFGNQTISEATISVTIDPLYSLTNLPPGAVLTANGFTFTIYDIPPYQIYSLPLYQMPIPASAQIGDIVTTSVSAVIVGGTDGLPENNSSVLAATVTNSFDPNDKAEAHGENIQINSFNVQEELVYTIRFQNLGTAPAFKVVIEDPLDPMLDETSVRLINTSHPSILNREGSLLKFTHAPIYLPQASLNEEASQGFVTFAAKLKPGFEIGDVIPNSAAIFFDFNEAIVTNTWQTTFLDQLSVDVPDLAQVTIYPNPGSSSIFISSGSDTIEKVIFLDMVGRKVKSTRGVGSAEMQFDISSLPRGIYLIEVQTAGGQKQVRKFIKN